MTLGPRISRKGFNRNLFRLNLRSPSMVTVLCFEILQEWFLIRGSLSPRCMYEQLTKSQTRNYSNADMQIEPCHVTVPVSQVLMFQQ